MVPLVDPQGRFMRGKIALPIGCDGKERPHRHPSNINLTIRTFGRDGLRVAIIGGGHKMLPVLGGQIGPAIPE